MKKAIAYLVTLLSLILVAYGLVQNNDARKVAAWKEFMALHKNEAAMIMSQSRWDMRLAQKNHIPMAPYDLLKHVGMGTYIGSYTKVDVINPRIWYANSKGELLGSITPSEFGNPSGIVIMPLDVRSEFRNCVYWNGTVEGVPFTNHKIGNFYIDVIGSGAGNWVRDCSN